MGGDVTKSGRGSHACIFSNRDSQLAKGWAGLAEVKLDMCSIDPFLLLNRILNRSILKGIAGLWILND